MLHKKHIYVIVVPDICCSKNPTTCKCFFFVYSTPECHHPISQCRNGIIEVLWLGIMIMFQLRHHRETACHTQPSVMKTWQIGVGGGPHLIAAHSESARQDMCGAALYSTQKESILIHVRQHVSIFVFFFCTLQEVGNYRRGCLLKQDMSAGDNANCCSGRLSRGNLQGHTPWVYLWVPPASSRLSA